MLRPEEVQHSRFRMRHFVFNDVDFAIGWGTWEDGIDHLGMRWNGDDHDPGYPKLFGHPVWLAVPENLARAILGDRQPAGN